MFNKDHIHDEVKTMVADLQLDDKSNVQANHLSGGMKRKLRYEIAFKHVNSHVLQCVLQCWYSSDWWFKDCYS